MALQDIGSFFESFLKESLIFSNKKVLQAVYVPDTITHRDEQLREVASILAPALKLDRPSNLFVYGMTGTGKTLVVRHITESMMALAKKKKISLTLSILKTAWYWMAM